MRWTLVGTLPAVESIPCPPRMNRAATVRYRRFIPRVHGAGGTPGIGRTPGPDRTFQLRVPAVDRPGSEARRAISRPATRCRAAATTSGGDDRPISSTACRHTKKPRPSRSTNLFASRSQAVCRAAKEGLMDIGSPSAASSNDTTGPAGSGRGRSTPAFTKATASSSSLGAARSNRSGQGRRRQQLVEETETSERRSGPALAQGFGDTTAWRPGKWGGDRKPGGW